MPNDKIYSRAVGTFSGRLLALSANTRYSSYGSADGNVLQENSLYIDFPATPDDIVLRRTTNYSEKTTPFLPDGIHVYLGTNPLNLEFSFKLHYADTDYCGTDGPYALLAIAARLHAFVLPVGQTADVGYVIGYAYKNDARSLEKGSDDTTISYSKLDQNAQAVNPPVACQLELMQTGIDTPGIVCRGYVKDVNVRLMGPYLKGEGNAYNLPTAAEYSFTFVHRPGHSNFFGKRKGMTSLASNPQAYAQTVKNRLYNTRDLVRIASYQGIDDPPEIVETTAQAQTGTPQQPTEQAPAVEQSSPIIIEDGAFGPREISPGNPGWVLPPSNFTLPPRR